MKKKLILLFIVILVFITGCGKKEESLKFIELGENKDVTLIKELKFDDKEVFIEYRGFKNTPGNVIIIEDKDNNVLDMSTNPEEYHNGGVKDDRKYYKVRNREFYVKFSNKTKVNKENINYECVFRIEVKDPIYLLKNNKDKEMGIEDFFNTNLKELINKELNDTIKEVVEKSDNKDFIDINILNNKYSDSINTKLEKSGYTITIVNFQIIKESNKNK